MTMTLALTFKPSSSGVFFLFFICCLATATTVKVADNSAAAAVVPSRQSTHPNTSHDPSFSRSSHLQNRPEFRDSPQHHHMTSTPPPPPTPPPPLNTSSSLVDVIKPSDKTSSSLVTSSEDLAGSASRLSPTHGKAGSAMAGSPAVSADAARRGGVEEADHRLKLHIVGLFAINGSYPVGTAFLDAAQLAEDDINNRTDILPGYRIVLEPVNTECDIATGMDVLYQKLYNSSTTKIMVLGGTCSDTTEQTAQASRKHNLLQISYSTVSPRLSSRTEFPWFFRVMAPETELSKAKLALMQKFNWTIVTFIQASAHLFSATGEVMRNLMQKSNMTVNNTYPFDSDPERTIEELKRNDARIIYFNSYEDQARNVCCVAFRKKFYGKSIVWIFPGFYDLKWYNYDDFNCTARDKLEVINGYFTASNVNMAFDKGTPIGATQEEYLRRFKLKALESSPEKNASKLVVPGESRAPLAYDSLWTIALTLNATLTEMMNEGHPPDVLKKFSYHNYEMGERIFRHMQNTSFRGLSGQINFTPSGDRIPQIEIKQFQVIDLNAPEPEVKLVQVGLYTNNSSDIVWNTSIIQWAGGRAPYSSRRTERVLRPLSWQLYTVMCLLACLGVVLSVAFLVFNIQNRNVRLIKMSSPKINNLILLGCMLVYCTVTICDVHSQGLDVLCHVRLYLLVMGFSLGFGALFAKTWRVYEIMTAAAGSRRLNTRALRDSRLYLIVLGLVAVNLCLLVVWTSVDTMTMAPVDIEDAEVHRDDDVLEIPQSLVCHSRYKLQFTSGLMALQALLILFGAFLAVQTRKVTIPELNDSRLVGLCIYNVVVLGSLGAILVLGTRQAPDVTYLLESLIVLVGTTLTQCLVFVPKLLAFRRYKRGGQGSQRTVTVKTLCMSVPSSSTRSKDSKGPDLEPSFSSRSPASSPSKALKKASHSLSTVLRKCCSLDREHLTGQGCQNKGYVADGQDGTRPARTMVSRAVSTCDLPDLSWLLRSVEAATSGESACQRALMQQSGGRPGSVTPEALRWIKATLLRPGLMSGVCSAAPLEGKVPCFGGLQKGCPLPSFPGHVCCCSLVRPAPVKGEPPFLRRCLSISTLDHMIAVSPAQRLREHPDAGVPGDFSTLAGSLEPDPAAPTSDLAERQPQQTLSSFDYSHDTPQGGLPPLEDPHMLMFQHFRALPKLPTASLLLLSGGHSLDDLTLFRALSCLSTGVTVQGLQRDAPVSPVFHAPADPAFPAACPSLMRSVSASQLLPYCERP